LRERLQPCAILLELIAERALGGREREGDAVAGTANFRGLGTHGLLKAALGLGISARNASLKADSPVAGDVLVACDVASAERIAGATTRGCTGGGGEAGRTAAGGTPRLATEVAWAWAPDAAPAIKSSIGTSFRK